MVKRELQAWPVRPVQVVSQELLAQLALAAKLLRWLPARVVKRVSVATLEKQVWGIAGGAGMGGEAGVGGEAGMGGQAGAGGGPAAVLADGRHHLRDDVRSAWWAGG